LRFLGRGVTEAERDELLGAGFSKRFVAKLEGYVSAFARNAWHHEAEAREVSTRPGVAALAANLQCLRGALAELQAAFAGLDASHLQMLWADWVVRHGSHRLDSDSSLRRWLDELPSIREACDRRAALLEPLQGRPGRKLPPAEDHLVFALAELLANDSAAPPVRQHPDSAAAVLIRVSFRAALGATLAHDGRALRLRLHLLAAYVKQSPA
jgi:hypothetical protein